MAKKSREEISPEEWAAAQEWAHRTMLSMQLFVRLDSLASSHYSIEHVVNKFIEYLEQKSAELQKAGETRELTKDEIMMLEEIEEALANPEELTVQATKSRDYHDMLRKPIPPEDLYRPFTI